MEQTSTLNTVLTVRRLHTKRGKTVFGGCRRVSYHTRQVYRDPRTLDEHFDPKLIYHTSAALQDILLSRSRTTDISVCSTYRTRVLPHSPDSPITGISPVYGCYPFVVGERHYGAYEVEEKRRGRVDMTRNRLMDMEKKRVGYYSQEHRERARQSMGACDDEELHRNFVDVTAMANEIRGLYNLAGYSKWFVFTRMLLAFKRWRGAKGKNNRRFLRMKYLSCKCQYDAWEEIRRVTL